MKIKNNKFIILIFIILNNFNYINAKNIYKYINVKSYILIDYNSKKILSQKNYNKKLPPASLTKIMTSYINSDLIKKKKINKNDKIKINKNSWFKNPIFKNSSLMFLEKKQIVNINNLNKGMIIQSGNDASVAIANYISGNEKNFIKLMNKYVKKINLKNTNFKNSHGLDSKNQYTTSKDMAKLSILLIKNFPETYKIYKIKKFTFNKIKQKNRNNLLWNKYFNIDGIKTGHTEKAGYNLITSAKKNNTRLISVILGAKSIKERNIYTIKLLKWGFNNFTTKKIINKKKIFKYKKIWLGENNLLPIGNYNNIYITYYNKNKKKNKIIYKIFKTIKAPINKYQIIGKININKKRFVFLFSLKKIKKGNYLNIILDYIKLNIKKYIFKIKKYLKFLINNIYDI